MSQSFLVKKSHSSSYHFRSYIPIDILPIFNKKQFLISLQTGILREAQNKAWQLNSIVQSIYSQIRNDETMKTLTLDDIKQILRKKLEQSKNEFEKVVYIQG